MLVPDGVGGGEGGELVRELAEGLGGVLEEGLLGGGRRRTPQIRLYFW